MFFPPTDIGFRATIREEAFERFWSIFPPKPEEEKIVAFPAAP
jgi:hypothetical protein